MIWSFSFISSPAASRNSVEDAYYEDADDNYPITRINGPPKNSCGSTHFSAYSCPNVMLLEHID